MFGSFKAKKQLQEVEERLEKLEREFKSLKLDWENTYDKLRSLMQRVVKRAEVVEAAAEEVTTDALETPGTALNERQRKINAQILARRTGGRNNGVLPG